MLRPLAGAIIMALAALAMAACDSASPEPLTAAEDATVPVTVAEDATVRETVAEDATVPPKTTVPVQSGARPPPKTQSCP